MIDSDDERFSARQPVAPPERVELRLPAPRESEELPLRLLLIGDHGRRRGAADRWKPVEVTKATLDEVLFGDGIDLELDVPNRLADGAPELRVRLRFRKMREVGPEGVAQQIPELQRLLALRAALTTLKGPLGGEKAFRNKIQNAVDDPRSRAALAELLGDEATRARAAGYAAEVAARRNEAASSRDPARLDELGASRDAIMAHNAAVNPATPLSRLEALSTRFPEEVARHPAVLRACCADPTSVRGLPLLCAARVLTTIGVAVEVLERWSRSEESALRELAAWCALTPARTLERLTSDEDRAVAWGVAENPRASWPALQSLLTRWRTDGQSSNYDFRVRAVVLHPSWPREALAAFTTDSDPTLARYLAEREDLPDELVHWLAHFYNNSRTIGGRTVYGGAVAARSALGASPRTALAHLYTLAADWDRDVRAAVATNTAAPASLLGELARDAEAKVRCAVAANPSASRELLLRMLEGTRRAGPEAEGEIWVRRVLASSLVLHIRDVARLAEDPDMGVRARVLRRADVSEAILAKLTTDPDELVRQDATLRLAARRGARGTESTS